jgi:rhodanese-related sulfurtransferase
MIKHVSVTEAHQEQQSGTPYLDVRSVPEFEQAHPVGAYNVPLLHLDRRTGQMIPNPDFVAVVRANFPPERPLLLGCQAGVRSFQACQLLAGAGYTNVTNVAGGFGGSHQGDAGWAQAGLPIETAAPEGRDYAALEMNIKGTGKA